MDSLVLCPCVKCTMNDSETCVSQATLIPTLGKCLHILHIKYYERILNFVSVKEEIKYSDL